MPRLHVILLIGLAVPVAYAGAIYDANLGTLPPSQGFTYVCDGCTSTFSVSGGLLHDDTTHGAEYWAAHEVFDFSQYTILQASLRVNSSNSVHLGDGTPREGYYLDLVDNNANSYVMGLADGGFEINGGSSPGASLTPPSIAGSFHTYLLDINNNRANFFIDGVLVAGNIAPHLLGQVSNREQFGAEAGASISNTDLRSFSVTTVPEPSPLTLSAGALVGLILVRRRWTARRA
jgi:hypothetical protein